MDSGSILFANGAETAVELDAASIQDLNLHDIFAAVVEGRAEYDLLPLLLTPLECREGVLLRQEVFRDVETPAIREALQAFAKAMVTMRTLLDRAHKMSFLPSRHTCLLAAVRAYVSGLEDLLPALRTAEPRSLGIRSFVDHISSLVDAEPFCDLRQQAERVTTGLASVKYTLRIDGAMVSVSPDRHELDTGHELLQTLRHFQRGLTGPAPVAESPSLYLNHIEEAIVSRVAELHQDLFADLAQLAQKAGTFADARVLAFDREIQLYLGYADVMRRLAAHDIPFCYPEVFADARDVLATDTFDLALALTLSGGERPVTNDFSLRSPERIFIVTGPNQGGKTTFARTLGQLHYLARLGFPVPGRTAQLVLADAVFTQFERPESPGEDHGKLEEELLRLKEILDAATAQSVVILNETFSSTTLADATFLGREILQRLAAIGVVGCYVTFVDELAGLGPFCVSMVAGVDPEDPARRTYRLERRKADGLAYARSLAEKHGLTYEMVRRSVGG